MTWRDTYRPAAFRGVTFHVESSETSHGRRQAVHEHAQRDVPYTEDLGRKAREFSVEGYLLGADYHLARNALIEACEQAGPGLLVHPYRGELTVVCRGLSVGETSQDGGLCRISLTFLEAGEASMPRAVVNSVNAIGKAGNGVIDGAKSGFLSEFLTDGLPGFVVDAASARLTQVTDFLASPGFNLSGEFAAAAEYAYQVRELAADAMDLVLQPTQLVDRLTGVLGLMRGAFGGNSFGALSGLFQAFTTNYGGKTNTPSRQQQAKNHNAMGELVRQVAVAEAAKSAVVTEYPSFPEAVAARETLLVSVDEESERTANDDAYVALSALRTEIVRGIPRQGARLPQLLEYKPAVTLPALLVAYQLYGDAGRADEIAQRNAPVHPGFLTGGAALQVLSNG